MLLRNLLRGIPYEKILKDTADTEITGVCTDSRIVQKGNLFVALSGGSADGHDFIEDACLHGAAAIVCERTEEGEFPVPVVLVKDSRRALSFLAASFYSDPQKKLKIIGVTGTNGKTTTCHFLASILKKAGKNVANIGTLGCFYGEKRLLPELTTPDPVRLFSLFADMVKEGVEYVAMEVSAHAVYYKKTDAVPFTACIFTNCTQDHLDFFKDMKSYAAVKTELFTRGNCGVAVLNFDDPLGMEIAKKCNNYRSYALEGRAENIAVIENASGDGNEIMLNLKGELFPVKLRLAGEYNVKNALAAAVCARELGISADKIAEGLGALENVSGRLQRGGSVHGGTVFIDFAHTPDALKNVLSALKKFCRGRLFCVFGCGGNRDEGKRPLMGEIAGQLTDFSVITSDNPRYEEPYTIISSIESGYRRYSRNYVVVQDRRKAIEYAIRRLRENDVLLIAGKGGEKYQEIMGIKYDYDEEEVVSDIIRRIKAE